MGQRVNIQYSVEIDDLQHEINRLFGNAVSVLDKSMPTGGTPVIRLGTDGLEKIDSIRQNLAQVDIMLGDVQNIVAAYVRFKTAPPEPEQTNHEDLEDKLARFKELLNEVPDQEPTG